MHRRIGGEDVLVADRRTCLKLIAAAIVVPSALGRSSSDVCLTERQESRTGSLDYKIRLDTIRKGFDQDFPAHDYCWVHPRAGVIPGEKPVVMVTMQKTHVKQARETAVGDDVYYAVNELRSEDMGRSWLGPVEHPTLGRREGADSISMVISGFMPQWHARTRKLLGTGSVLRYSGKTYLGYLQRKVPRETGYAVYDAWSRAWSGWTVMEVPDRAKFYHEGADSCQRVDLPDGEILLPTYFADTRTLEAGEDTTRNYIATVIRCAFDGSKLRYVNHGDEMTVPFGRGLAEPSLTYFRDKFFLTLRNDERGYVTSGTDGQHFSSPKSWKWDDGADLGSYNTQQHWVTHSDGLFLIYTRLGAENDQVPRNRAPIFMARVDQERLCLIRSTERILIPNRGADLGGGFGVVSVNETETWVVASEWVIWRNCCERYGADNSVYAARILWNRPNRLAVAS